MAWGLAPAIGDSLRTPRNFGVSREYGRFSQNRGFLSCEDIVTRPKVCYDCFSKQGKGLERGKNMFVVYFCGEYEFDENGYNVPKARRYETLEAAQNAANKFYERTRCFATVTRED